ncbi:MAG: aminodeoxychorismate synthase component I [Planctomycetes bacterium]|nr:aminodeoxychorismate synthase component I [Planctomycetota bacterium]
MLESAAASPEPGRWTILGLEPARTLETRGDLIRTTERGGAVVERRGDPLAALDDFIPRPGWFADCPRRAWWADVPFFGGAIGFFGYDLRLFIERLAAAPLPEGPRAPDLALAWFDAAVVIDRVKRRTWLTAHGENKAACDDRLADLIALWVKAHMDAADVNPAPPRLLSPWPRFTPEWERGRYEAAIRAALEHIGAGDIYQVNLAQPFAARYDGGPARLYQLLRERNPAPFAACLSGEGWAVLSSSPERFLSVRGREVETWPIKGTRPASPDPLIDAKWREELLSSAKDAAELAMIVDLERNDLGRVCEYGSVRVIEPRRIERYATVQHLVARVGGTLREGVTVGDLLRAAFPGGSITGAPKIRAMEIINELEREARGPYTGAIGYLGVDGRMDLNVAIRTIVLEGNRASLRLGAGIVADSDPGREYDETLAKGQWAFG